MLELRDTFPQTKMLMPFAPRYSVNWLEKSLTSNYAELSLWNFWILWLQPLTSEQVTERIPAYFKNYDFLLQNPIL